MWRRLIASRLATGVHSCPLPDLDRVELAGIEVLSLDVFDTCIGRAVLDAVDIFDCIPSGYSGFREERITAEHRARIAHVGSEPTLHEIYAQLDVDEQLRNALLHAELSTEAQYSRVRNAVLRLAQRAAGSGITIVYLSDMYLSSPNIRSLLDRGGFPRGDVLVSNELGANKSSGSAFELLVRRVGVSSDRILHVGDNLRSDGLAARRAGINTIVVERAALDLQRPFETFPVKGRQPSGDSIALGLALATAESGRAMHDPARAMGCVALGPAQLAFTMWVRSQAADDPVLFCSRDMLAIHRMYAKLADRRQQPVSSAYLHISRRSVGLPALAAGVTSDDREFLVGGRGAITEHELWARIGVERPHSLSSDASRPLLPHERDDVWQRMFEQSEPIVARAAAELAEFSEYWDRSQLPTSGSAVLVDVGWRATVQRGLVRCLALAEIDVTVRGRYLGLLEAPPFETGDARGWFVDRGLPHRNRVALEAGIPVIELAFQAAEGSVERYANGLAVTGPANPDRTVQDALQAGADEFIDEWMALDPPVDPTAVSLRPLLRLLNSPRPAEARLLGSITHTDRLGTTSALTPVLPSEVPRRVFVPTAASRRRLRASEWRPGLIAATGASAPMRRIATTGLGTLKRLGRHLVDRGLAHRLGRSHQLRHAHEKSDHPGGRCPDATEQF